MDLLEEWAAWNPEKPPYVLKEDRPLLYAPRRSPKVVEFGSWEAAYQADDFGGRTATTSLHLGVLPQPYCGDLRHASIYVLGLNALIFPSDYFGESQVASYHEVLVSNLRQRFDRDRIPFVFLDPQFGWHRAFEWWNQKLRDVIQVLANSWSCSFAAARERLARQIASIELLPYHSETFPSRAQWLRSLYSVNLACSFVSETVLPRVEKREAIVIVPRTGGVWELPKMDGIVAYPREKAQAASLKPGSLGGDAILALLTSP
jgi:hypothetical protein